MALLVGVFSVLLGGVLGITMGIVAGFRGGRVESSIMRVVDIILAFPDLITGLLVIAVLGDGVFKLIIAIGLGAPPPTPAWGQMIRDGAVYLTDKPLFSLMPGIALLLTVLAFNLVGDGLRDVLDPKSQT